LCALHGETPGAQDRFGALLALLLQCVGNLSVSEPLRCRYLRCESAAAGSILEAIASLQTCACDRIFVQTDKARLTLKLPRAVGSCAGESVTRCSLSRRQAPAIRSAAGCGLPRGFDAVWQCLQSRKARLDIGAHG